MPESPLVGLRSRTSLVNKLWIASLRLRGILRVDPNSWEPEFFIPFFVSADKPRYHAIAWDKGAIWQIIGNDSNIIPITRRPSSSMTPAPVMFWRLWISNPVPAIPTDWQCTTVR
jgi:hypothetical protein